MDSDGNGWIDYNEFMGEVWQFRLLKRNRINRLRSVQLDMENRRLTPWYYKGDNNIIDEKVPNINKTTNVAKITKE